MSSTFQCPACGQTISTAASGGMPVLCPVCRTTVTVPAGGSPQPYGAVPAIAPNKGLAIAALVCGIVGLVACPGVGLVGLILGIVALSRVRRLPDQYAGRGMAIGGICTGSASIVFAVLALLMLAIMLPSLSRAREQARQVACAQNLRQVAVALVTYTEDNRGHMPPDLAILAKTNRLPANVLSCPSAGAQGGSAQAYYQYIPNQTNRDDPRNVLLFEQPSNHCGRGMNVAFLDGHVQFVTPAAEAERLIQETRQRLTAQNRARSQ